MRIYYFIITLIISFCVSLQAQNNADKFKQQAQSSFENKDYTKARYLYIQAYKDYANEGKITQAIECGTQAASCLVLILVDCVLKKSCYRLSINVKKQTILS